jgi:putative transposase
LAPSASERYNSARLPTIRGVRRLVAVGAVWSRPKAMTIEARLNFATQLIRDGNELLTFFTFPKAQWKTLRTTNTIERLHEEFRRRVKTQGSLPGEDATLILLFSLVGSGQIKLRRIDGWRKIAAVLAHTAVAA